MHGLCKQLPTLWRNYFSNETVLENHAKELGTTLKGIIHVLNVTEITDLYKEFFIREALGDHYMTEILLKAIRAQLKKFMETVSPKYTKGLLDDEKLNMTVYELAANIKGGAAEAYQAFFNEVKVTGLDYVSRYFFAKELHVTSSALKIPFNEFLNGTMEELRFAIKEMTDSLVRDASLPLLLMLQRRDVKEPLKDLIHLSLMNLSIHISKNTEEFIVAVYNISDETRNIMKAITLQSIMSFKKISLKRLSMLMISVLAQLSSMSDEMIIKTYLGGVYIVKSQVTLEKAMSLLNFTMENIDEWDAIQFHQHVFDMDEKELDQYFDGHIPSKVFDYYKNKMTYGEALKINGSSSKEITLSQLDELAIRASAAKLGMCHKDKLAYIWLKVCNFIRKRLRLLFSCEVCEIFINSYVKTLAKSICFLKFSRYLLVQNQKWKLQSIL